MPSDAPPLPSSELFTGAVEVLLVSEEPEDATAWMAGSGSSFSVVHAPSVEAAAERLARGSVHVVVLDSQLAVTELDALPRLRQHFGHAALLVHADHESSGIPELLEELGGAGCLLPATAPGSVKTQLIEFAAQRARYAEALSEQLKELEQSKARFRDVIERNADAILVVDREGVIRFANGMAAELFRSSRQDLPGTPFGFPIVAGETTELDLLHPGQPRTVEMRVVESQWEGETAYIASLREISERKRAEEGARRLIREQVARAAAETAAHRFRFLAEATTLLSLPLSYTATLSTLARLCVREMADWAALYTVTEKGRVQRLEVTHRDPAKAELARGLREQPTDRDEAQRVLEVLRTRSPLLVSEIDEDRLAEFSRNQRHLETLQRLGAASFMLVPLVARERELGAIALFSSDARQPFSEEDLAAANDLALRAALAVDNARLYDEARKANQAKTDLLAVISHDLRTPLNSIIGHADLLSMGIPEPLSDGVLERIDRIRLGATHLLYLIDQLLSYSRLESGHEELRVQEIDPREVAWDVAGVIEPLALERGLTFNLDVPGEPMHAHTDSDRLRQVLLNLVGNALKYTEEGKVLLELRPAGEGGLVFSVRDTGIGIRPEHIDKIFEPFWQVDETQRANRGGAGLGLSVVQRLVHLLGGTISVESEVGRGSVFTVHLPATPPV